MPVSSQTSLSAASSKSSPSSSLPLGKLQSSYLGRWTTATWSSRSTRPPAANTSASSSVVTADAEARALRPGAAVARRHRQAVLARSEAGDGDPRDELLAPPARDQAAVAPQLD